jgi:hypothetical protein
MSYSHQRDRLYRWRLERIMVAQITKTTCKKSIEHSDGISNQADHLDSVHLVFLLFPQEIVIPLKFTCYKNPIFSTPLPHSTRAKCK